MVATLSYILFDILDQQTLPVGDTIYPKEPNMDVELIIEEIKGGMTSLDVSIIKLSTFQLLLCYHTFIYLGMSIFMMQEKVPKITKQIQGRIKLGQN